MKPLFLAGLGAAALIAAMLGGPSAGAVETGLAPAKVVDSGPHGFDSVTHVTPEIRKDFPLLGSLSARVPAYQLRYGGPALQAVEEAGAQDK